MHRSGSSAITHILTKAGFFVGDSADMMQGNQWNRDGYFERWSIAQTNDMILSLCGGRWDSPPAEREIARIRIEPRIETLLKVYEGHQRAIIKDPRMCLTFPVWQRVLREDVFIISITRHPESVAASLMKRDGFTQQKSLLLWGTYTSRAIKHAKKYPCYSLKYEDLFSERRSEILKDLATSLGILVDLDQIAQQTVDRSLQHYEHGDYNVGEFLRICDEIQNIYTKAQRLIHTGKYEAAITKLEKLLHTYPAHALAHNDLGVLYSQKGEKKRAINHIEKSLELDPHNSTTKKNFSILNHQLMNREKVVPSQLNDP
jgi:hypothetical protein